MRSAVALSLLLASCASADGALQPEPRSSSGYETKHPLLSDIPILPTRPVYGDGGGSVSAEPLPPFTGVPGYGVAGGLPPRPPADPQAVDRKLIFNASLVQQVGDPSDAEREIRRAVDEAKGWVHRIDGTSFTLRVPAAQFDATLEKLAKIGRTLDRKVGASDVTEEYHDLELRIANGEAVRARLAALLEKAKDVKEALEVERELARVTEEIERLKGKIKAMSDAVSYSTIVIALQRTAAAGAGPGRPRFPFPWVRRLGLEDLMEFRR